MESEITLRHALALSLLLVSASAWANRAISYSALTPAQKALFSTFVTAQNEGSTPDETYWDTKLEDSQALTFVAITHAMEHTELSDQKPALSLIKSVEEISGSADGAKSFQQFNLKVIWEKDAEAQMRKVGFRWRMGHGHDGEHGISHHSGIRGLHLLFNNKDGTLGHMHVDYRWLLEGHSKPYNADVRANGPQVGALSGFPICNRCRHEKWYGKIEGWPSPLPRPQP